VLTNPGCWHRCSSCCPGSGWGLWLAWRASSRRIAARRCHSYPHGRHACSTMRLSFPHGCAAAGQVYWHKGLMRQGARAWQMSTQYFSAIEIKREAQVQNTIAISNGWVYHRLISQSSCSASNAQTTQWRCIVVLVLHRTRRAASSGLSITANM
jgi:hypothetical protein